MRRRVFVATLALFALWFVWKAVPWLDRDRPATYATPTVQPYDAGLLSPIVVKGGKTVCTDAMPWGPDARAVQFTMQGTGRWPNPAIALVASRPGYRATAQLAAGAAPDVLQTLAITPARTTGPDGKLCLTNAGRHEAIFYGIAPGRGSGPSVTTVDGAALQQELSITLLTHADQPLIDRLGTVSSHAAAFRPLTGWEVFLLGLLAAIGVPVAIAFVLARTAAQDDEEPSARR